MTINKELSRRSFLKSAAAGAGAAAVPVAITGCGGDDDKDFGVNVFSHGVASGDPLTDSVIIWTRITPEDEDAAGSLPVGWSISENSDMSNPVQSGTYVTDSAKDFTVKVDVKGLQAGTTYYYRFTGPSGTEPTDIGQTKTLPEGSVSAIKFAVCSCANYPAGFFNVYEKIASSSADIVLHLGDYIYEYQSGTYPSVEDQVTDRAPDPVNEIVSLADYRKRYAQYRRDVQLQSAHKAKPFICVWDDHELANDAYKNGAENHNEGEGEFATRREEAFQAYHEWMPIRTGSDLSVIYRQFEIGDLVNLQMLDTRHVGRDKPVDLVADFPEALTGDTSAFIAEIGSSTRTLLGTTQNEWATSNMINSSATWQVLGQQVLMGRILVPTDLLIPLGQLEAAISGGASAEAIAILQTSIKSTLTELATIKAGFTPDLSGPATGDDLARLASVAPYNLDAWDGYQYEREVLLNYAAFYNKNLVVLAGDTHNAWASELRLMKSDLSGISSVRAGVELATSSVSSPGFDEYLTFDEANPVAEFEGAVTSLIDDLKFFDASRRGFLEVEFTPTKATATWNFVNTVKSKADVTVSTTSYEVLASGASTSDKLSAVPQ